MNYHIKQISAMLAALILTTSAAAAPPFHVKKDHKFGDRQYAASDVRVDASGNGRLYSHYSNCHPFDGDTYATFAVLLDRNGRRIGAVDIRAGLNAKLVGCTERGISKDFTLTPAQAEQVAAVEIEHKELDTVNDGENWRIIIAIIERILGPSEPEQNGVHWAS